MTDKTKPWLSADHPEAVACKVAVKKLSEELKSKRVDLTGIGVGLSQDGLSAAIRVYLKKRKDKSCVPSTYDGYEVHTVVTGAIRLL